MAKEMIVYQANPLIEGRRDFSLIETRLFYIGLRGIVPKLTEKDVAWRSSAMQDFPTVVIPAKEMIQLFGNRKYYSTLEEICDKMAKKTVKIKHVGKEKFDIYTVFSRLSYDSDEGLILEFNPKMKPWLLELADKPFTKLPFEQIWALRSGYAIRLLELLLQYQNTKTHERTLTIEDLKQYFGMSLDSYEGRNNTFKEKVIMGSIKDINEKTSYKVEVETVKEGRKIVAFKFKLHLPAELKKLERERKIKSIGEMAETTASQHSMPSDSGKRELSAKAKTSLEKIKKSLMIPG